MLLRANGKKQWFYNGVVYGKKKTMVFTMVLLRVQRKSYGFTEVLLRVQQTNTGFTMVLRRVQQTSIGFTFVLLRVQQEGIGFTMVLFRLQRNIYGCTMVLLSVQRTNALVLQWFCVVFNEKAIQTTACRKPFKKTYASRTENESKQ